MILLTGDSGFIGSYLAPSLLAGNKSVRGVDVHPLPPAAALYDHVAGDILEPSVLRRAGKGVDAIVHLAAEHKDFGIPRDRYFRTNVEGTKTLLALASGSEIRKFIFFSSVAVYGNQATADEETLPRPVNPYGESKLEAEQAVAAWAREDASRSAVIIRPTVIFGPWSKANIFKLIRYVCDGKFVWVGDGHNVKSVAYIKNLVSATVFLLERMRPGIECFNYADEPDLTTKELVSLIAKAANRREPRLRLPLGPALAGARVFDVMAKLTGRDFPITTARLRKFNATTHFPARKIRALGFQPPFTIEQGISENVRWYLDEYKVRTMRVYDSYDH